MHGRADLDLGILAHELRNHLGVMQNALFLLRRRLSDMDARVLRPVEILENEVQAVRALAEDLLVLAKGITLHPEVGDVAAWVREAVLSLGEVPGVEVVWDTRSVRGRADRLWLARAVRNLVLNATEMLARDGGRVEVSVERDAQGVAIRVADSGRGLPPAEADRVFEAFYTRKSGGTGLGLTLVRLVAEAHGGCVRAENRPEGGAVFTIRLPDGVEP